MPPPVSTLVVHTHHHHKTNFSYFTSSPRGLRFGARFVRTTGVHFGVQDPVHQPIAVNLGIVILSFGLAIKVSLLGILGLVVGVVLHRKL